MFDVFVQINHTYFMHFHYLYALSTTVCVHDLCVCVSTIVHVCDFALLHVDRYSVQ